MQLRYNQARSSYMPFDWVVHGVPNDILAKMDGILTRMRCMQ